jgi:hypothetical protein
VTEAGGPSRLRKVVAVSVVQGVEHVCAGGKGGERCDEVLILCPEPSCVPTHSPSLSSPSNNYPTSWCPLGYGQHRVASSSQPKIWGTQLGTGM